MTRQPTPLLQACAARGVTAHAGFEMLVQQIPEYLRFFGLPEIAQTLQEDMSEVRALLIRDDRRCSTTPTNPDTETRP